jgi:hypothetical protein
VVEEGGTWGRVLAEMAAVVAEVAVVAAAAMGAVVATAAGVVARRLWWQGRVPRRRR